MRIIRPTTIQDSWIHKDETNINEAVFTGDMFTSTTYNSGDIVSYYGSHGSAGVEIWQANQVATIGESPVTHPAKWDFLYIIPDLYRSGVTYSAGDVAAGAAIGNNTYPVYHSQQDSNTGNDPDSDDGTWWHLSTYLPGTYDSTVTYAEDDLVADLTTNRVFISPISSNTGNALTDTNSWLEYSATDLYKLIDGVVGTSGSVSQTGNITFKFTPTTPINSIGLLNLTGISVTVSMANTSYSTTKPLTVLASGVGDVVQDWYSYYFSETRIVRNLVFMDIPVLTGNEITISIDTGEDSTAELGEIIIGKFQDLGVTQYAPEFSIIDYSIKRADGFGNYEVIERAFSKKISIRTIVPNYKIGAVSDILTAIRATPVLWVPTEVDTYDDSLLIYGFYKDFKIIIPHANWADMDLQIEGLT